MDNSTKKAVGLIQTFMETVKEIGAEATSNLLKNAKPVAALKDENIDFVFNTVSRHFKVSVSYIINSSVRNEGRRIALGFIVYYLHNSFEYKLVELKRVLKRHKSQLSRLNKMVVQGADGGNADFCIPKKKMDIEINTFLIAKNKRNG